MSRPRSLPVSCGRLNHVVLLRAEMPKCKVICSNEQAVARRLSARTKAEQSLVVAHAAIQPPTEASLVLSHGRGASDGQAAAAGSASTKALVPLAGVIAVVANGTLAAGAATSAVVARKVRKPYHPTCLHGSGLGVHALLANMQCSQDLSHSCI